MLFKRSFLLEGWRLTLWGEFFYIRARFIILLLLGRFCKKSTHYKIVLDFILKIVYIVKIENKWWRSLIGRALACQVRGSGIETHRNRHFKDVGLEVAII